MSQWNPSVLFSAFRAVGMVQQAVFEPSGAATPFQCGYTTPDIMLLGDQHMAADIEIEWPTADLPAVRKGAVIAVTLPDGSTVTHRAAEHARKVGDGTFSRVYLEVAS